MTSRYRFSVDTENDDGRTIFSNTIEFDAEQLDDVVGNFELFLKGAGFGLDGHVDITTEPTTHNTYENIPGGWDLDDPHAAWDLGYQGGDLNNVTTETADIEIKRPDNTEGGTLD
jgi:hypothetical protein